MRNMSIEESWYICNDCGGQQRAGKKKQVVFSVVGVLLAKAWLDG